MDYGVPTSNLPFPILFVKSVIRGCHGFVEGGRNCHQTVEFDVSKDYARGKSRAQTQSTDVADESPCRKSIEKE